MTRDEEIRNIFERLRQVETALSSHLSACDESNKAVAASSQRLEEQIVKTCQQVVELKSEHDKARGVGLAIRWLVGIITVASIIVNIVFAINQWGK